MKRKPISLKTKLCSALCQLVRYDEHQAEFVRIIPHDLAKRLSEEEILAIFDWHHFPIPVAHGGPNAHWNLEPMERAPHKKRTAEIDIPRIAKSKRITASQEDFRRKLLAKDRGEAPAPSRWPKREMPKRQAAWGSQR